MALLLGWLRLLVLGTPSCTAPEAGDSDTQPPQQPVAVQHNSTPVGYGGHVWATLGCQPGMILALAVIKKMTAGHSTAHRASKEGPQCYDIFTSMQRVLAMTCAVCACELAKAAERLMHDGVSHAAMTLKNHKAWCAHARMCTAESNRVQLEMNARVYMLC